VPGSLRLEEEGLEDGPLLLVQRVQQVGADQVVQRLVTAGRARSTAPRRASVVEVRVAHVES
jgi:hypothetical protein